MSIQYMNSNSRPLEHESPLITTRPGLPPYCWFIKYVPIDPVGAKRSSLADVASSIVSVNIIVHYIYLIRVPTSMRNYYSDFIYSTIYQISSIDTLKD